MRIGVRGAAAALGLALAAATPAAAKAEELALIGRYELPSGLRILGVRFGGISALDYDAEQNRFFALSDDRGGEGPPRFYELGLLLDGDGIAGLDMRAQTPILMEGDAGPEPGAIDPEALRLGPSGALYWAQEGGASRRPSVGVMGLDGRQIASFQLPAYYMPPESDADGPRGVRDNYGFESLAVDAEGRVVVALESALEQDGPLADLTQGADVRVLALSPESAGPVGEYVYPLEPLPFRPTPADAFATTGLVELLARPEGGFYALERSFAVGQGTMVSIYKTSFEGATNVLGAESLGALEPTKMKKELLYSVAQRPGLEHVDNLEAMSFGPKIDGKRSLILMSDDNFTKRRQFELGAQVTQILLFEIQE